MKRKAQRTSLENKKISLYTEKESFDKQKLKR